MSALPHELNDVDHALMQCLSVAAQRGAQIRAELRAQYGEQRGDEIMSELARKAERAIFDKPASAVIAAQHTEFEREAGHV